MTEKKTSVKNQTSLVIEQNCQHPSLHLRRTIVFLFQIPKRNVKTASNSYFMGESKGNQGKKSNCFSIRWLQSRNKQPPISNCSNTLPQEKPLSIARKKESFWRYPKMHTIHKMYHKMMRESRKNVEASFHAFPGNKLSNSSRTFDLKFSGIHSFGENIHKIYIIWLTKRDRSPSLNNLRIIIHSLIHFKSRFYPPKKTR